MNDIAVLNTKHVPQFQDPPVRHGGIAYGTLPRNRSQITHSVNDNRYRDMYLAMTSLQNHRGSPKYPIVLSRVISDGP